MESQETPEECMKREAYEEGYISGSCSLLGKIEVDHHVDPNWNQNSPYPKVGYQVYYRMEIDHWHSFEAEYESVERKLIDPSEFKIYYHDWNELHQEILDYAVSHKQRGEEFDH
ncbi:hypothetical protein Q7A53_11395 [Halobacillus rhizosphaerae]|uniref:hypothetical protein n=1 Tax=Halobacillus rhizosphaerae TaxID=3064889 RepID=UPI00398A645A